MDSFRTRSTSAMTAVSEPIVLRDMDTRRLVFLPMLVKNPNDPDACVKGIFVYQRKNKRDEWESITTESLGDLKAGEGYKLELHSDEVLKLGLALRPMFEVVRKEGLPRGERQFVSVDAHLAQLLSLTAPDLQALLDAQPTDAIAVLAKLFRWLAEAGPANPVVAERLQTLAGSELPSISALLNLLALERALEEWRGNEKNSDEDYWQDFFVRHSGVLSHVLSYPIVVIREKAYLGGKRLDNKGGKEIDFLAKAAQTDGVVLIEIKTPTTDLLGAKYRGVFPLSVELNGALSQVLHYRQRLQRDFASLALESETALTLGNPRCIVIAGHASIQLDSQPRKESFELLREKLTGLTVITFDELFARVEQSVGLNKRAAEFSARGGAD